ncbi:MAG: Tfx family DNA-binding protein [Candidatus Syntrophoarchaeum sp.]|nr:Tfx family DNA-binding protein [Candidatus Syntrophoarchaeum sp.]
MQKRSFLTRQQVEVLGLRELGLTQREIAERIGTTRENVSIIEKRAKVNIERCRETLREWERIRAPITIKIPKGTDIFDIPGIIFDEADRDEIRVELNKLEIIATLEREKKGIIRNRLLTGDLEVLVMKDGGLSVY